MLGFNRWHVLKGLTALVCILGIAWLALAYFIPAPPSSVSIATSFRGGAYELFGNRYSKALAKSGINLNVLLTKGALENLDLLQDSKSGVAVAFVQGGSSDGKAVPGVISLGRINYQVIWVFQRASDTFDQLTQLKGRRIAVGQPGSATHVVVRQVLAANGVNTDNTILLPLSGTPAIDALVEGKVDVTFLTLSPDAPLIQSLLQNSNVKLMNIQRADALVRLFPYLVKLVMPQGVINLENNIPPADITLIATTNAVLVRRDLHPAVVMLLAQALVETHGAAGLFQRAGEFPTRDDPEYPMAESAVRFYDGGLPWLNQYLPFWFVPHIQRLFAALLAGGAIVFPLFSLVPRLFKSLVEYRLSGMYRRLRAIEANLLTCASDREVSALGIELDRIDKEIRLLGIPLRHSDLFFAIRFHLNEARAHLDAAHVRLLGQAAEIACRGKTRAM